MTNEEKYRHVFVETFSVDQAALPGKLEYNSIPEWDSIGHMGLVADLEDTFDISMEMDDVIDLSSYEKGKQILAKYGVLFATA